MVNNTSREFQPVPEFREPFFGIMREKYLKRYARRHMVTNKEQIVTVLVNVMIINCSKDKRKESPVLTWYVSHV